MKTKQIREMAKEEIINSIKKDKEELQKELGQKERGIRPEKPKRINALKKDIARKLTILKEKEVKK